MINKKKEGVFYASKVRLFLNEYDGIPLEEFCKAEEQQFAVLSSRVSSAEREKHEAQKKARLLEQKNSVLESEKADMQRQLNEKIGEVAETVKGPVTLSDSLRDAIVAGVKEEFEAKLSQEREAHSKEMQSLKDQFALMLAAKDQLVNLVAHKWQPQLAPAIY